MFVYKDLTQIHATIESVKTWRCWKGSTNSITLTIAQSSLIAIIEFLYLRGIGKEKGILLKKKPNISSLASTYAIEVF